MALLIVNADDYGLTDGVSTAILRGHHEGIVTSTSLLAIAPAFDRTSRWLADAPTLGTGAHLALVGEDPPLLTAREIPTLVDDRGRLAMSWRTFLPKAASHRIDPADVRREIDAQLGRIESAGLTIDHLDTHQNLHLWPSVRDAVLDAGEARGVRAIRVTRSAQRRLVGTVVRGLSTRLMDACDRRGWTYPAASTGLDEAGHLDESAMVRALRNLARSNVSSAELATHPGEHGDADLSRYDWDYRWGAEGDALCAPAVRAVVEDLGFELGTFGDLTRRARR
jgi:predicted glycoside hydrolase/deacetylase ChbG (UPF0249 family)